MVHRASGRGYAAWAPTPQVWDSGAGSPCGGGYGWDPSEEGPGLALEVGAFGMWGHGEEILLPQPGS